MEGSPYRKFFISWKGARFQGPNSGFLLAGTWSVPLSGTRWSGSCLEAGENDTGVFFPNSSHTSSGGIVRDLEVQIGDALVPVDFCWGSKRLRRNYHPKILGDRTSERDSKKKDTTFVKYNQCEVFTKKYP